MAWLAVEQNYYSRDDGTIVSEDEATEVITQDYPEKIHYAGVDKKFFFYSGGDDGSAIYLPKGTIKKILGFNLTVYDAPVEIPNG